MLELKSYLGRYTSMDLMEEEETTMRYHCPRDAHPEFHHPFTSNPPEAEIQDPGDDSCEDDTYPGRVYLSLGILAEETTKLTALLAARQRVRIPSFVLGDIFAVFLDLSVAYVLSRAAD